MSCAAIQSPPGGLKDEIPPELIQTIPDGGSIHFKGGRVELIFSEFVDANTVERSIRVLPTLPEDPEIIYKGRRIFVEFPDSLNENQTYIISIDRTLKDEHKVALAQGIQVAFATGDKIFFAQTLFKESDIEIFSLGKFKETLFIIFVACW